jgi:hypothetical protein
VIRLAASIARLNSSANMVFGPHRAATGRSGPP